MSKEWTYYMILTERHVVHYMLKIFPQNTLNSISVLNSFLSPSPGLLPLPRIAGSEYYVPQNMIQFGIRHKCYIVTQLKFILLGKWLADSIPQKIFCLHVFNYWLTVLAFESVSPSHSKSIWRSPLFQRSDSLSFSKLS